MEQKRKQQQIDGMANTSFTKYKKYWVVNGNKTNKEVYNAGYLFFREISYSAIQTTTNKKLSSPVHLSKTLKKRTYPSNKYTPYMLDICELSPPKKSGTDIC
eukprot:GEMP01093895.1.p1 GENE.GEMP01093895.1~~GEMP01093895.1.p1  ORF type:complete len:102 (+),score=2.26 GEMP01093895.1:426-731(+)